MKCTHCGAEVPDGTRICPNCGKLIKKEESESAATTPYGTQYETPKDLKNNGYAATSFALGLLSFWLSMYFCIASVLGIGLGVYSIFMKRKHNYSSGNGFGIAGIILNSISLVLWVCMWIGLREEVFNFFSFNFWS